MARPGESACKLLAFVCYRSTSDLARQSRGSIDILRVSVAPAVQLRSVSLNSQLCVFNQPECRIDPLVRDTQCPHFIAVFVILFACRGPDQLRRLNCLRIGVVDFDGIHQRCLIVITLVDFDEQTVGHRIVGIGRHDVGGRIERTVVRRARRRRRLPAALSDPSRILPHFVSPLPS